MIDIIQGEKQTFNIDLTSQKTTKPFDLTGNVDITVCFKSGTTVITKKKSLTEVSVVGVDELGQITGFLTTANTDAMTATTSGDIEVHIDFGSGDIKKTQLLGAFTVTAKLC